MEEAREFIPLPIIADYRLPERWSFFFLAFSRADVRLTTAVTSARKATIIAIASIGPPPFPLGVRQLYHNRN